MLVGELFSAEGGETFILSAQPFTDGERAPGGAVDGQCCHFSLFLNLQPP